MVVRPAILFSVSMLCGVHTPNDSTASGSNTPPACSTAVESRGAVVSAALSERKVAGSIPTIGDFHTVGPCKKAVFACLATDVK